MKHTSRIGIFVLVVSSLALCGGGMAQETPEPAFRQWGEEALATLNEDLWMQRRGLYAEKAVFGQRVRREPAFMWSVGVQLTAMAAAARMAPETYLDSLKKYADAIDVYWLEHNGLYGYDVLPGPKRADRYYDDNAWMVLAMLEIYEATEANKYLERAEETFKFVMSGEDEKLGGGLYWRENELKSKNTCTNAPAIVSALRLYQLTGEESHRETAGRLYQWTCANLQAGNGLFWDHVRMDGSLDRRTFTYNSALMIRANVLFYEISKEQRYLDEAQRIARAAEDRWVRDEGAIADGGRFAHLLVDALLDLHRVDHDDRWRKIAEKSVVYVRENLRDSKGRYSHRWDRKVPHPLNQVMLLDQASVARAFWMLAADRTPAVVTREISPNDENDENQTD